MHTLGVNVTAKLRKKGTKLFSKLINNPLKEQLKGIIQIKAEDKSGKMKTVLEKPIESYVANFARLLSYAWFRQNNSSSASSDVYKLRKIDGTFPSSSIYSLKINAPSGNQYGIMLGENGTPTESGIGTIEAHNDYTLRTIHPNNSSNGLYYYGNTIVTLDGNNLIIKRRVQNLSTTSSLSIQEIGLFGLDSSNQSFLFQRDILNSITLESNKRMEFVITYTVTNQSGLTTNYLAYLLSHFTSAAVNMRNTNNAVVNINFTDVLDKQDMRGNAGTNNSGIVIGGGNETWFGESKGAVVYPGFNSVKMDNLITHNSSVISYGAMVFKKLELIQNATVMTIEREFENNSNSKYYLNEVGLLLKDNATTPNSYLMYRNGLVDDSSRTNYIILPPGEVLTLTLQLLFPLRQETQDVQ